MLLPSKFNSLGMLIPIVLLVSLGSVSAKLCEPQQFWSSFFNNCLNCTECVHPDMVITPCEGHRDTICGPLSDLKIDWSWMKHKGSPKNRPVKEMTDTFKENLQEIKLHELHVKQKENLLRKQRNKKILPTDSTETLKTDEDLLKTASKQELWDKLKAIGRDNKGSGITNEIVKGLHKPKLLSEDPKIYEIPYDPEPWKALHFNSDEAKELLKSASKDVEETTPLPPLEFDHEVLVKKFSFFPLDDEVDDPDDDEEDDDDDDDDDDLEEVSEQEIDFSATERVILDYQTGILYLAIGSVLVFFCVALCYSLKHLRSLGSRNYTEDLEELQFWLTKKKDPKKSMPSTIYKTTTEVVSKGAKGHCKYLERIISKNAKKKMNRVPDNVYHAQHPCMETRPLTAPSDPEVHKPTNL